MWDTRNGVVITATLAVVALCVSPLFGLLFSLDSGTSDAPPHEIWNVALFARSALLNAAVALAGVGFGAVLAYVLVRWNVPFRLGFLALFALPLFIPSYIHALIWSRLLGPSGALGELYRSVSGNDQLVWATKGWWGTIGVLVLSYYPVALLIASAALLRWDRRHHEAAMMTRGPRAALWLQTRYMRTPLMVAGVFIFFLSFSDFGVPDLFQVHVYATEIFIRLTAYLDTRGAVLSSLLPLSLGLILMAILVRLLARVTLTAGDGRERRLPVHSLGIWRYPVLLGLSCLAALLVLLPLGHLVYATGGWAMLGRALAMAWQDTLSSALLATLAAVFAVVLALLGAYGCVRRLGPAGPWLRFVPTLMLVLPASLLGLGFILFWNRSGWMGWVYHSGLVMVFAVAARWLPVTFEVLVGAWSQLARRQEEAAYVAGAHWFNTFRFILLPQLAPALRIAALLAFIFAFNELTMMVLLSPPGVSTLPMRIFSTVHYGPDSLLAALSLSQVIFLLFPVGLLIWFSRPYFTDKLEPETCSSCAT